jgi:hypothetical protein
MPFDSATCISNSAAAIAFPVFTIPPDCRRAQGVAHRRNPDQSVSLSPDIRGEFFMKAEPHTVVTATDARQGVTGHNVRYVLIISVAASVVIFAGLLLYYFA